jgi:L-alanine-DL-glutamate epimerase-like enolase superfamily enzyme
MKITSIEVTPFQMQRQDKNWRTSIYAASTVEVLGVQVHTDEGITGVGACTVMKILGFTTEGQHALLTKTFAPMLIGEDPFDIEPLLNKLESAARFTSYPVAAIDSALWDIKGKALGVPVYSLLGGAFRKEVPVIRMVGVKEPDDAVRNVTKLVESGYRYLKLKVGPDPVKDVARVRAIRKAVGDDVVLTADANGAYDVKTAIRVIRQLEELDVAVFEEPVRWDDLHDIAQVTKAVDMPIMGDQSIRSLSDVAQAVREDAVDAVCIKLHSAGGIVNAQKARAVCEAANVRYHIGGTGSSWILGAGTLHLAAASPNPEFGVEIGEAAGLDGDIVDAPELIDGKFRVPEVPGLGLELHLPTAS